MVASKGFARNMVPVVLVTKLHYVWLLTPVPLYCILIKWFDHSTLKFTPDLFLVAWWNSSSKDIRVKEDHLREVLRPENRSALRQDTFNVNVEIFLRTDHRGCFFSIYSEHHHTEEDQTWFHPLWAFLHYFFPDVLNSSTRDQGRVKKLCHHETFARKPLLFLFPLISSLRNCFGEVHSVWSLWSGRFVSG